MSYKKRRTISFSFINGGKNCRFPDDYESVSILFTLSMRETISVIRKLMAELAKAEATEMLDALVQVQLRGYISNDEEES